jgi:hypothetical protein
MLFNKIKLLKKVNIQMTKNKILQIMFTLLMAVICFMFGTRVEYNVSLKKYNAQYSKAHQEEVLSDVKSKLFTLKCLQANDNAKAVEVLERLVDADLYSLAEYELVQKVSDKEIEKIVRDVKSYRDTYKDHKVNSGFEKTINNLLNKYK